MIDLYARHQLNVRKIAEQVGVEVVIVHNLIEGKGSMLRQDVEKVLAVISQLTGRTYTRDTVYIRSKVKESKEEKA